MSYQEKKFDIPEINGISKKTIDEHLKLYAGYVKHTNLILEKIEELSKESDPSTPLGAGNVYAINELQRRFAFEFDGMRNHEYYFEQLEGGMQKYNDDEEIYAQVKKDFGSTEVWYEKFIELAMTRGIGWAILYYDKREKRLLNAWVDEQHLGHLTGLEFIFGIDMWEHSYLLDYTPGEKKKYIESYMQACNPRVYEKRFADAIK